LFFALLAFLNGLASASTAIAVENRAPLKVGFLNVGPVSDFGWNYSVNQGRLYLESHLKGQVQTSFAEKVPESAEAERVLEKMIAQGNKLIFTASYGYLEPALRVAARHPDVIFMQVNRFKTANNLGTVTTDQYQAMYLAGIVAGRMTKTNKFGFIAAHPIPHIIHSIDAFMLGAKSVNPKAETQVMFINSWSDPPLEAEAVKSLAEEHCDVIAHAQDNQNTILSACESAGLYSCGFYTDGHQLAPKGWLTGARLDWGPFYVRMAKAVMDHSWKPYAYTGGMESDLGVVKLSSFGKAVPASVQKEVLAKQKLIESGKLAVFTGPIKDDKGKERIAAGKQLDQKEYLESSWFVEGVHGTLPTR
jgi:basic membrane lipoprotein Med (substrate-binding protein (PBP1-ABC) superfamily)